TDTADVHGRATGAPFIGQLPALDAIDRALDAFRGTFAQQPPVFSAKKIQGRRSYDLARANARRGPLDVRTDAAADSSRLPSPGPTMVTARALEVLAMDGDTVTVRVDCSAGFYVRSLAHDLGLALGTGAHLVALRRTRSGGFGLDQAVPLDEVERDVER